MMRRLLTVLVVGMVLGGIALAWLGARMIETGPRVALGAAPAYEDIARVKALLARFAWPIVLPYIAYKGLMNALSLFKHK